MCPIFSGNFSDELNRLIPYCYTLKKMSKKTIPILNLDSFIMKSSFVITEMNNNNAEVSNKLS